MSITEKLARHVLEIVDAGLSRGMGKPEPGNMCVEAAVCYAMGLDHNDNPPCVAPAVRRVKIALNDQNWGGEGHYSEKGKKLRAEGLRRVAVAQLGSKGVVANHIFARRLYERVVAEMLPDFLEFVGTPLPKDHALTDRWLHLARDKALDKLKWPTNTHMRDIVYYGFSNFHAAHSRADVLGYGDVATILELSETVAANLGNFADYADYAHHSVHSVFDVKRKQFAKMIEEILVELGSPGAQFLYLCEEEK